MGLAPRNSKKTLAWLKTRPSLSSLREAFPDLWKEVESDFASIVQARDHARLHRLLYPFERSADPKARKAAIAPRDKAELVKTLVKQRMLALAVAEAGRAIASGTSGKLKLNLWNGLIIQKLFFEKELERKPVSSIWFKLLWPLVGQKRLLMPLVEPKGIYGFYSRGFVTRCQARSVT